MKTKLFIILNLVLTSLIYGSEIEFIKPTKVFMEVREYENNIDPYLAPIDKELKYGGIFNTDFYLIEWNNFAIFSNNMLHFDQSQVTGKVKHGGWQYELGLTIPINRKPKIEIGKGHHSRHIFEEVRSTHFPVEDHYFIRFNIYP